jgi:hypothetical protein
LRYLFFSEFLSDCNTLRLKGFEYSSYLLTLKLLQLGFDIILPN